MSVPERAKAPFLGILLALMVGSYFISDTYTRGTSMAHRVRAQRMTKHLCPLPREESIEECTNRVERALVPANLACIPAMRDASVCNTPGPVNGKDGDRPKCRDEERRLSQCLQTYLERELLSHGFSAEVIAKLRLGDRGDTPQELPKEGKEKPEDEQGRGREGGKDEEVGQEQDEMEEVKGIGQEGGGDTEQEQADADKTGPKVKVEVKADSQDGDGKPR